MSTEKEKPLCYFCYGDRNQHDKVSSPEDTGRTQFFFVNQSNTQQEPLKNFSNTHLAVPRMNENEDPEL